MSNEAFTHANSEQPPFFTVLGLNKTAEKPEIIRAYRQLAKTCHPDKVKSNDSQKELKNTLFTQIAKAYSVLADDSKKAQYLAACSSGDSYTISNL